MNSISKSRELVVPKNKKTNLPVKFEKNNDVLNLVDKEIFLENRQEVNSFIKELYPEGSNELNHYNNNRNDILNTAFKVLAFSNAQKSIGSTEQELEEDEYNLFDFDNRNGVNEKIGKDISSYIAGLKFYSTNFILNVMQQCTWFYAQK